MQFLWRNFKTRIYKNINATWSFQDHPAACLVMEWDLCGICGGGGDLKCPADSHQKNGLEVYSNFLEAVKEFEELQSLPVNVDFKGEDRADLFMANRAKWHKHAI